MYCTVVCDSELACIAPLHVGGIIACMAPLYVDWDIACMTLLHVDLYSLGCILLLKFRAALFQAV